MTDATTTDAVASVLPTLLGMSATDRRAVIELLEESLTDDDVPPLSPAWQAELDRRLARMESGEDRPIDGEEFLRRMRENYL